MLLCTHGDLNVNRPGSVIEALELQSRQPDAEQGRPTVLHLKWLMSRRYADRAGILLIELCWDLRRRALLGVAPKHREG
jgi:hypothetical protein